MKAFASAGLTACLVCFATFLGLSAGQAGPLPPAALSPLVQSADPIAAEALAAIAETQASATPAAADAYDSDPDGDPATAWQAVASGGLHACGIKADGTLECWGDNSSGQASPPDGQFFAVAAGLTQSCAIRLDGKLLCWGTESARPNTIPKGTFKDVSAGDAQTCAIRHDGAIRCWGSSNFKQLKAPKGRFESLSAGGQHACAVRIDGRLACWGEQSFMTYERPQGRFKAVATGETHACALRDDGSVVCWGNDAYGQIQPPEGAFKSIAAGNFHTCGLRFDGSAACWGRNDSGELDVPVGESFQALAAGGAHVCGLRQNHSLNCWGSQRNAMSGVGLPPPANLQSFPFSFLTQIFSFLGTGLVNYGKGVDKKWSGGEAKAIPFQWAFGSVGIVMSALQLFLPKPPDPVVEALKRVEADLQELKAAVARIESTMKQIDSKLNALACNVSLQALVNTATQVQTAQDAYSRLIESSQIVLKAYADRAQDPSKEVPDINPQLQKFVDQYEKDLRQALNAIQEALVPAISNKSGPLEDCMVKSFEQWKSKATQLPFDDRLYYQSVYEILGYALTYQNMALVMLQDIDLWHAQQQLNDGKIDYSPGDMVGYCAIVREKAASGDSKSAYWRLAQISCDDATALTDRTYKNMVTQIERAGAPYTGEDTVLSLGSNIVGKGPDSASQSWLWVRDVDAYGDTKGGARNTTIQTSTNPDKTKDFLYYPWKADGQAWITVQDELIAMFNLKWDDNLDLPSLMSEQAGFKNITRKVFWMPGKTFEVSWPELLYKANSAPKLKKTCNGYDEHQNMYCFIASDTGGSKHPISMLGVVCNSDAFSYIITPTYKKRAFPSSTWDIFVKQSTSYNQYIDQLGKIDMNWSTTRYVCTGPTYYKLPVFFMDRANPNGPTAARPRWPVLDIAGLKCTKSMTGNGRDRPKANSVGAPTRCGDDFDRLINALVPRPDSVTPRVELPSAVKDASVTYQPEGQLEVCHIAENLKDWSAIGGYSWEVTNPALDRSATLSADAPGAQSPTRSRQELGALVGAASSEAFTVRCRGTALHGPTGTRYAVESPWSTVSAPW
ncbi:MAG: hypothetical protein PHT19_15050 [Methylococcus sp.]|nr:hypothetical protein [Methylococcus sp.]